MKKGINVDKVCVEEIIESYAQSFVKNNNDLNYNVVQNSEKINNTNVIHIKLVSYGKYKQ